MPGNHTSKYAELTDYQFLLIGKLFVEFSNVEFLLSVVLARLLITPSFLSRTFTDRMNINTLIDKIRNALDIHERRYGYSLVSKELCKEIMSMVGLIDEIRIKRNKFAHYCWSRSSDEEIFGAGFISKQASKSKPNKGSITITNQEIKVLYDKCYRIGDEIEEILQRLPELLEDKELKSKLKY